MKKPKYVYFISGMCYNCKVFDGLRLPKGYERRYIEWYVPRIGETLDEYARKMAESIDRSESYALVGYSFGAVIMQEMTRFLKPEKSIIISSFKSAEEIPPLFHAVKISRLASLVPDGVFSKTGFITNAFNRLIYHTSNDAVAEYMTMTDPVYVRWAVERITEWTPDIRCEHLYHIHGTDDQIFPYDRISDVLPVKDGDHLMVARMADTVSSLLDSILLINEKKRRERE